MLRRHWLILNIICAFSILVKCQLPDSERLTISLKEGLIRGRLGKTVGQNNTYYAFQGIPFAEPPLGKLRFEPPVPKKAWKGIFDATKDGQKCIQHAVEGSEDCLVINVYVPKINTTEKLLLPVMVWVHGGGFFEGNSSFDHYGPDYFLDEQVIVVTFNYRLGIFGFLSTGDSVVPGNMGLKDQVLALKWVQNNIQNFGGNSRLVTIFGQSAGSVSVSLLMQSPSAKGLFRGAIMESGVSLCSWGLYRVSPWTNRRLAEALSINNNSSRSFVEELKRIKASSLQIVSSAIALSGYFIYDIRGGFTFGPVSEPKGSNSFFTGKSYELLSDGKFSQVPFIVGFNSLELAIIPREFQPLLPWFLQYDLDATKLLPVDLNVNESQKPAAASLLKNYYFVNTTITNSGINLTLFSSDDLLVKPIREYVRLTSNRVPVYFYRFSYDGFNDTIERGGVSHAEELYYFWNGKYFPKLSPGQIMIRNKLVKWWTQFAKFRNPTPIGKNVSTEIIWKKSDNHFTYLDINTDLKIKQFPEKENMEIWDRLYNEFGNPPYDTY